MDGLQPVQILAGFIFSEALQAGLDGAESLELGPGDIRHGEPGNLRLTALARFTEVALLVPFIKASSLLNYISARLWHVKGHGLYLKWRHCPHHRLTRPFPERLSLQVMSSFRKMILLH